MPLTLEQLNTASAAEALQLLDGVYEHSPWIAEQALAQVADDVLGEVAEPVKRGGDARQLGQLCGAAPRQLRGYGRFARWRTSSTPWPMPCARPAPTRNSA